MMKATIVVLMLSAIALLSAGCQSEANKQNAAGVALGNQRFPDREKLKDAITDFDLAFHQSINSSPRRRTQL